MKYKLTQMVKSAGCAAKIFPDILSEALKDVKWATNENVIVGFDGKDDAGVYKINDDLVTIHTTDFFTPVVDDPYTFGQIAVTNALSDIYAMGGVPINALNIVAFPQTEDLNILKEILSGGSDKINESGAVIIGGHSVDIPTILYGMAVTGISNPKKIKTNQNAKDGDLLILTKKLGTGMLNNLIKFDNLSDESDEYKELINSMTRLNKNASEIMVKHNANACTDITGFGLAGHSMQMAKASGVNLIFNINELSVLNGVDTAISKKLWTRGDKSNRDYTAKNIEFIGNINEEKLHIIYDPQTAGGLLISIPEKFAYECLNEIKNGGDENAVIIGEVKESKGNGKIIFKF
ncbi:MAG TPA: selenide, water dikinase SelD [Bacteroidetes bacterium]|nr:selenide, water dikinase SelD [Ignavibacteria bacterium]HCA42024.1 selenide, water dikinase SelD [Bacteroidota bacterium]HCN36746.1 selenide, water dikinase SelD [Bacteroidota bacterium]